MNAENSTRRGFTISPSSAVVFAAVLLLVSCAGGLRMASSLPGPERPAERVGAWGITVALYDPALYGPERPLAQLIKDYQLALDRGKLKNSGLLVNKAQRRLELWVRRKMVKAYRIQLGRKPQGTKRREGDQRTPEGKYFVCGHSSSIYYRALWLSYPNADDARRGFESGLIRTDEYKAIMDRLAAGVCPLQNTKLGGEILIHGQIPELTEQLSRIQRAKPGTLRQGLRIGDADPAAMREYQDWTEGCIALFNPDIRELYEFIPDGTEVTIVANAAITAPGKGSNARIQEQR